MTRFARAGGSKSCNKKVPEDGTPWSELKKGADGSESSSDEEEDVEQEDEDEKTTEDAGSNSWCVIENNSTSGSRVKRKLAGRAAERESHSPSEVISNVCWDLDQSNSEKLLRIMDTLSQEGKTADEINKYIRNKVRTIASKNRKMNGKCYNCQGSNHKMSQCPQRKGADICFTCGSTEHKFRDCKMKKSGSSRMDFATCFICKESGHISTQCPDNPTGLYPAGGGCWKCGEVTHLSRDCPKSQKNPSSKSSNKITLPTISDDVEGLIEDKIVKPIRAAKKQKIVNF